MTKNKKLYGNHSERECKTKKKHGILVVFVILLMAGTVLSGCSSDGRDGTAELEADANIKVQADQDIVIPISEISEIAKFYPVDVDGTRLEVVAVRASDGSIRTAFNTCQVCYDSGNGYYKQQGDVLVCQNCGNQFPMDQVEVEAGGCNPWPIFDENKTVTEDSITISYNFLKDSKGIFANWKGEY